MSLSISSNLKSASTPDIIWSLALFLMIVTVAMYNIYASCFWCNLRYFLKGSVSQYCVSKLKNSSTFLVHSNPRSLGKTCIYLKCRQCTHKHTHIGPQTNKHQEGNAFHLACPEQLGKQCRGLRWGNTIKLLEVLSSVLKEKQGNVSGSELWYVKISIQNHIK